MAEIQIGSLVTYTERKSIVDANRKYPRNGSIGTVLKVTDGYQNNRAFDVNWHSGGCLEEQNGKIFQGGWYAVWTVNLDLAEIPYDPTQMGDTDEDI